MYHAFGGTGGGMVDFRQGAPAGVEDFPGPAGRVPMTQDRMMDFRQGAPAGVESYSPGRVPGGDMQFPPTADGMKYAMPTTPFPGPQGRVAQDPTSMILSRFGLMAGGQQMLPHQINPARWDAMGQIGRDLTKNLAETAYGYDAEDFERQINATRPVGTARRAATYYAPARGLY